MRSDRGDSRVLLSLWSYVLDISLKEYIFAQFSLVYIAAASDHRSGIGSLDLRTEL